MTRKTLSIFFFLIAICESLVAQAQLEVGTEIHLDSEYTLAKNSEGITVYNKIKPKKGFVEYKAQMELDESEVLNLLNFFHNSSIHPQWIFNCLHSKMKVMAGKPYLYQICNSPWPLKNRDLSVLTTTEWVNKDKILVHFNSRPNVLPKQKKLVRIQDFDSTWVLEKKAEKIKITVWASFDPKLPTGSLFLKSFSTKIPFETLRNLKELYQSKK